MIPLSDSFVTTVAPGTHNFQFWVRGTSSSADYWANYMDVAVIDLGPVPST